MATAIQKIACLSNTRQIPFNKLILSQANVRRTKANVSIEDLAESIARRGLLQNLNVRPVLDAAGQETGLFEVPAGGRRFRALELLVRSKRLAKTVPVPCNVREAGSDISAEEDSLAENTHREDLHPLDQFRAFKALVDAGQGVDDVAARFFVTPTVVKQRLRLASVADVLLDAYADDELTLEQLMAFTVSADQARQVQVWNKVKGTYQKDGYSIRRLLTESSVAAGDGSAAVQSQALKRALQPYCLNGPWGRLLDADAERLGFTDVQAVETEGLIGTGAAAAVLAYLFHRIEDRLDGRPTLLIVDEGWLALDDEGFSGQLREWLKTLRKKNASVVFSTQSLADIDQSAIAPAIIESCPTRIFLANERALEPQIAATYRRFGLSDRQIEILSRATPKRDYYCQSRRGNRLFELGLGEVALAFAAASSKTDQQLISDLFAAHGRDGFARAWLNARGVGWAVRLIPTLDLESR